MLYAFLGILLGVFLPKYQHVKSETLSSKYDGTYWCSTCSSHHETIKTPPGSQFTYQRILFPIGGMIVGIGVWLLVGDRIAKRVGSDPKANRFGCLAKLTDFQVAVLRKRP